MASQRCQHIFAAVIAFSLFLNSLCFPVRKREAVTSQNRNASPLAFDARFGAPPPEVITEIFGTDTPTPAYNFNAKSTTAPNKDVKLDSYSVPLDDDEENDGFENVQQASTTAGGSNIFSLLNLAGSLFPGSSGNNAQPKSSSGQQTDPISALKAGILRSVVQYAANIIGLASSSSNMNNQ